jgi:ribosomal protein L13
LRTFESLESPKIDSMAIRKTTAELVLKYRKPMKCVHLAVQGMVGHINAAGARGKISTRRLAPY